MNLEDQVCSLELAKRLKELGVTQISLTYWLMVPDVVHMKLNKDGTIFEDKTGSTVVDRIDYKIILGCPFAWNIPPNDTYSAFTAGELGELLPERLSKHRDKWIQYQKIKYKATDKIVWLCSLMENIGDNRDMTVQDFCSESEANTRADMLIYLIKNKLIKPE